MKKIQHQSDASKADPFFAAIAAISVVSYFAYIAAYNLSKKASNIAIKKTSNIAKKVTIAQFGDVFLYAPIYIAKDAGFLKKRGVDASFVSTGGDEKTWAAVLSGNAQFGVADPTFVAISGEKGIKGVVVASLIAKAPFWAITYNKNIPFIETPAKLRGYSVATFPSPSTSFTLQKQMFLDGGLVPNIRQGAYGSLIAMLKSNQADIALEIEPNVSQSTLNGSRVVYGLDEIYGDFQTTGITTLPSFLSKDPTLASAVVCAVNDSLNFIRNKPEEAVVYMVKRFPEIKPEVAAQSLKRMSSTNVFPNSAKINRVAWDNAIALRKKVGDLKTSGDFNVFVNNQFADGCN